MAALTVVTETDCSSEPPHDSPVQVCPTDPPTECPRPECLGWPNPPNAYRCTSRSTKIENSVETTLFDCPCCSGHPPYCDDELCDGNEKGRCTSELLKGCHCMNRNAPYDVEWAFWASEPSEPTCVNMESVNMDLFNERSTTPTGPPPASGVLFDLVDKRHENSRGETVANVKLMYRAKMRICNR